MVGTKKVLHPKLIALGAFLVVIVLSLGLEFLERERFGEVQQTKVINTLGHIRANLESEINANFYLTRGLIAYISTHRDIDKETFSLLAKHLLKHHNYIRNIAIARDTVVEFVYPLAGNERAIGLNYRNNTEQWPSVARIIDSGKTVIAGPVNLVQGGVAFISRTPIYTESDRDTSSSQESFWGVASIVIDKERLFAAAGLHAPDLDIEIAMKGKDGMGAEGELIEGNPEVFAHAPVLLPVNLPEGSWQLAATPRGGWKASSPNLPPLRIAALLAALLLALATYVWLHRQDQNRKSLETAWLEAKKAQADLHLSEKFLNTVIDNIPAMIFVKDAQELRFVRLNKTGEKMIGYTAAECLGKTDFDFFPEAQARFFIAKDRETLQLGNLVEIAEEPIETKDQGKKFLHTRKIPIASEEGTPLFLLGISEDITEKLKERAEKSRLEQLLHQAQKLETIGTMAGGVAHDLNNILSGIINYPELLLLQLPPESPLRKPIMEIHNSGKRAARVVADLLTIARGVAAVKETTNLKTLILEHLASPEHLKLCATLAKIALKTNLAAETWNTSCSPVHIKKCLMNLINNAAESFSPDRGGEIIISLSNEHVHDPPVKTGAMTPGQYVLLSVADNGPGIGPADLEHIFEPFYTKKAMGRSGTGLGLTVVWNTMQDHRGAVTVSSVLGQGTTFSLYFPATIEGTTPRSADVSLSELSARGQSILIVDDEPHQRDIAASLLQALKYTTHAVASGEQAIDWLRSHTVDLVILDMVMDPGMNGRKTYEGIIAMHPGQKAVLASGLADSDEVAKIEALGVRHFISKPYTIEQLGVAVQSALQE